MNESRRKMVFFHQGDVVKLKEDLPNMPEKMFVLKVAKNTYDDGAKVLLGVDVLWFDKNQTVQKVRFNTKDLEHVNPQ